MSDANGTSWFSIVIAPIVIVILILVISHFYHPTLLDYLLGFSIVGLGCVLGAVQIVKGGALDNMWPYALIAIGFVVFILMVGFNIG